MDHAGRINLWQQGVVDRTQEHFKLSYGDNWSKLTEIALIGRPSEQTVNVQFLIDNQGVEAAGMVSEVRDEIDFYLIENGEPDPWGYAQHHCGTLANAYSRVHWSFYRAEEVAESSESLRRKAEVILEVGSEGGSIFLLGRKDAEGAWCFWLRTDETVAYESLDEEDQKSIGNPISTGKPVKSLTAALKRMDRYPWSCLSPLQVHPEFRDAITREVGRRAAAQAEQEWERRVSDRF